MEEKESEINSLESQSDEGNQEKKPVTESSKKPKKGSVFKRVIEHINIYLLIFIFIVIVVSGITYVSYQRQQNEITPDAIPSQQLNEEAFGQLQAGDASVGDPKQTLTVQSNSIFTGQVLARGDVEVAGALKVGGTLNLSGLIVDGNSTFDQIQANEVNITGDSNLQGQLSVGGALVVTGGASFGAPISAPAISVESLQLSGDLQFTRHIDAGGPTPSQSSGNGLGSGGTVSVSGTDTAGSVSVNTGGSAGAGCFVTVRFAAAFSATPHVVVTPIGANAAAIQYYVNRTTTEFSICAANNPSSNSNFGFDYIVID